MSIMYEGIVMSLHCMMKLMSIFIEIDLSMRLLHTGLSTVFIFGLIHVLKDPQIPKVTLIPVFQTTH